MRIKHYAYFRLASEDMSADEIARRVGLRADKSSVRGSELEGPRPKPLLNSWQIVCEMPGLSVGEHICQVVDRIRAYEPGIRECVDAGCSATMQVVRYLGAWLDDDEGEEEERTITPEGLEKLPGQHQLLGWHLGPEILAFLTRVGAELDLDEYG